MVVIATLKQENGVLSAYIRKDGRVEKFDPGTAYYGEWDIETLTEAVFIAYPTALFVSSDTFDDWVDSTDKDEETVCYACGRTVTKQDADLVGDDGTAEMWWCGCED